MTKVFLDTNVLLDYLLDRPGADMAECILKFSEEEGYELLLSSLSMSNIAYITRKVYSGETLYKELELIRSFVGITLVDENCVDRAIALRSVDFEDSLQYLSAKQAGADVILTSNIKHFPFHDIPVMLPKEFITDKL